MKFQFHKVQLKVLTHSIGDGNLLFQFHKVQLKV